MITVQQVVLAQVTRVEAYGVYFSVEDDTILVLLPELSWAPVVEPRDAFPVGSKHQVLVTRYVPTQKCYVSSIVALDVANNPYLAMSQAPDAEYAGRISSVTSESVSVFLDNHAIGYIANDERTSRLRPGERVSVRVRTLDVPERQLWLELCENVTE